MTRSMPVRLRWSILKRDGFRCTYCGRSASQGAELHVDHIIAWSDGGTDDPKNLTTACADCNLGKWGESLPSIQFEVQPGETCYTRLLVAAVGYQCGYSSYRAARNFLAQAHSAGSLPPPDRQDGKVWTSYMAHMAERFPATPDPAPTDPTVDLRNPRARKRESRRDPNP